MSKKTCVCIIVILASLLLITGTYTIIHYCFNYSADEWFRESINNGDYVIVGKEIGDTIFGGDTQVVISIFDHVDQTHMTSFETRIANNGDKLTSDNYKIVHNEEFIKVVLIGSDNQSVAYTFFFEDFE